MTNELNPTKVLTGAIRHIRRVHMNCRTWTLPIGDEKAIEVLTNLRQKFSQFHFPAELPEFDRINMTGPFEHPVSEPVNGAPLSTLSVYQSVANVVREELKQWTTPISVQELTHLIAEKYHVNADTLAKFVAQSE